MRKILFIMIALFAHSFLNGQEGISFKNCTWQEAVSEARSDDKPIFIDFYTEWCGPCYNMSKNIFVLHSVGSFYNDNFICLKIDAEKGEGVELARRYNVRSYPTYLFVDSVTESEIHRSSGSQERDVFLFTGASALQPKLRSTYLIEQYEEGNRNPDFLIDYAMYKGSIHDSKSVDAVCALLDNVEGYSLSNKRVWNLFVRYVKGVKSSLFKEFVADFEELESLYGKESVSSKLYEETKYLRDRDMVLSLPNFIGKDVVLMYMDYDMAFNSKDYVKASEMADCLMAYNGVLAEEVCRYLYYVARSNLYGEYPHIWHSKCLEVSRFVAYNHPDRDDASIHQLYALQLEMWAGRVGKKLIEPSFGVKEYSMRPKDLKAKPKK